MIHTNTTTWLPILPRGGIGMYWCMYLVCIVLYKKITKYKIGMYCTVLSCIVQNTPRYMQIPAYTFLCMPIQRVWIVPVSSRSAPHAWSDACKLSWGRVWPSRSAWDWKCSILHQFVGHGLSLWPSSRLRTTYRASGCYRVRLWCIEGGVG